MAEQKERMVSVRGALGMYHSVPESQVAQYLKDQKELQDSGELERRLEELDRRAGALLAEERTKRGRSTPES